MFCTAYVCIIVQISVQVNSFVQNSEHLYTCTNMGVFLCRACTETSTHSAKKRASKTELLCSNIGIRRSFLSELKAGRTKSLSTEVLSKIAAYFNVSVDYLLTGNQKENLPQQPQSEVDAAVERIRRKLESMPKEQREALMNLIEKM